VQSQIAQLAEQATV